MSTVEKRVSPLRADRERENTHTLGGSSDSGPNSKAHLHKHVFTVGGGVETRQRI